MKNWKARYQRYFELVDNLIDDKATVLIVGANDGAHRIGDPTQAIWKNTWNGYFMEPDPDARKELEKNWPDVNIIPLAVAEENGEITLYKVDEKYRRLFYKVRNNDGSCVTSSDYNHVKKWLSIVLPDIDYRNAIVKITVKSITLNELDIKPDIVQIDIEGMDHVAARQALECFNPKIIMYEHQLIEKESKMIDNIAKVKGYNVEKLRMDTILWRA